MSRPQYLFLQFSSAVRSQPLPSAGRHLLLLQAVPHPPIPAWSPTRYPTTMVVTAPECSLVHFDLLLHICSLSHEFCYVGGDQLLILKFHRMIFCLWILHQFLILKHQCLSTDFCVLGECTVHWGVFLFYVLSKKSTTKIVSWKVHVHLLRWF